MEEYEKLVPCPAGCKVVYTKTTGPTQRKGEDYDSYFFDVVNAAGEVISTHEVRDSMSVYPPFQKSVYLYR